MKKILTLALGVALGASAFAQKYGATPEDSLSCLQNLSVYQEFFKQKNYVSAYDSWKKVTEICPATSLNTYIRGNTILKTMIAKAPDATKRAQYMQELMNLWDLRIQHFGRPGFCLGMKARDMRTYMPKKVKEAYELYKEAMTYSNEPGFVSIPYFYFEGARDAFKANVITKEELIEAYDKAVTVLDNIQQQDLSDTVPSQMINSVNRLFEPYASCEDLIGIYTPKFESIKSDANALRKATNLLSMRNCTDSEIFFKMAEALYQLEPDAKSAYMMATMCYKKQDHAKAIEYLTDENIAQLSPSEQENAYLLIADASMKTNRYSNGRDACNKALKINPNSGRAYILLGSLYAAGASVCPGDGTPIAARAPYWAAVDMFYKAKAVEPDLAETVGKLVATYAAHFPSNDDLFTYGLKEGDSYTISCWFTHTTTIRAR